MLRPAFSSKHSFEIPVINTRFEIPVINTRKVYFPPVKDNVLRPDRLANNIPVSYVYINLYTVLCIASRYSR